jgi:hypothetical protein
MEAMDPVKPGADDEGEEVVRKKPYRRPEILYREPLEAMAALCTPAPPAKANVGMCPQGPIQS